MERGCPQDSSAWQAQDPSSRTDRDAARYPLVRYGLSAEAWNGFASQVESLITDLGASRVLEVGGGAKPTIPFELAIDKRLDYTVLDISAEELRKAPDHYRKIVGDIGDQDLDMGPSRFDVVFSRMLAEHVRDGKTFHRNVFRLLADGGVAFHFFPTLYALPFTANWLLPEWIGAPFLHIIQSGRQAHGRLGKFPAYYRWCRGPTGRQILRLERIGYVVEEYVGFFGHDGYYTKLPAAAKLHGMLSRWLVRHPSPWLTSFAWVILRRPNTSLLPS